MFNPSALRNTWCFAAALLLAPLLQLPAIAQALDPAFTSPTSLYAPGAVYALGPPQADGKRLVAGRFSRINGTTISSGLVRLNANGALDRAFLQNVGAAGMPTRIKRLANGQYLLLAGSTPLTAGGLTRMGLLRLNADGTADAAFNAGTGPGTGGMGLVPSTLDVAEQADGKLIVAGTFDAYGGAVAQGVVRLLANGRVDSTFSVGAGVVIYFNYQRANAVAVQPDGNIVLGGNFRTFDGQPANSLIRLRPDGSPDPTFAPAVPRTSYVENVLRQPDGKLLVNGYLSPFSNPSTNPGLVRLLPSGALDPGFTAPVFGAGSITTNYHDPAVALQPDGKLLVAGSFAAPASPNHVVRLNPDGSLDATFGTGAGPADTPTALGLQANGIVLVGSTLVAFDGRETPLTGLTNTGTQAPTFQPVLQRPGTATAVLRQPDGRLLLAGDFTELSGQLVHRLVRLSASGALETGFAAAVGTLPGGITCLALQADGKVLAGTGQGVFRFAPAGLPDPTFAAPLPATALAMQADGRVLVGGDFFRSAAGTSFQSLARLTSSGALDPTFDRYVNSFGGSPGIPMGTDAVLVQPDGRIVVAGSFRQRYAGVSGSRVARYLADGGLDATYDYSPEFISGSGAVAPGRIYALALQPDGKLLAGGSFARVGGLPRANVARLTATGAVDASFGPGGPAGTAVFTLARQPNGRVLLGGSFALSGPAGALANNLGRVDDSGTADGTFANTAAPNDTVRSLLVQPDGAIVLAGRFITIGGQPAVGLARITAPNVLAVAGPAPGAARLSAWPVPAHGLLHIAPKASARPQTVALLDALGRLVRQQAVADAVEVTLDVAGLPAGVYVLRVQYAEGTVTRPVVVE